ncbi:hypothetical protein G4G27_22270 [Sphingomonas sp. So64.6b]|uniref:hypothetical protein n=1 Tax=Sphingomonas sp. So64.6b TaxID=2997354 RepID=UPI00160005E1|nr:hypothetical protein [Sphingomonas sp. So64.6b]QNA86402.1 hypothetical protein G4G27_22270 [Sphingomonas sp. So64.6b]
MRWIIIIAATTILTACDGTPTADRNAGMITANGSEDRTAIARRAANPDFSAVDSLANQTGATNGAAPPGSAPAISPTRSAAAAKLPVVTDPRSAIEAAIQVSARGDDGIRTLPLSPDLLVALRRVEATSEVGSYDHDFLTGSQEALPVRILGSSSRRTVDGLEVTHRIENAAGSRTLVSVWSPRGDGSWQLEDVRAEGTTLLTLLTSDGA